MITMIALTIGTSGIDSGPAPGDSEFRPGDQKTIRIQVNSSEGFEPRVKLFANNQRGMTLSFHPTELQMASNHTADTNLSIDVRPQVSTPLRATLPIYANLFLPSKENRTLGREWDWINPVNLEVSIIHQMYQLKMWLYHLN
ncbi:MAG: hypothetical protein WAM14_05155 [Candidatus Nitrosopolaris sp.]